MPNRRLLKGGNAAAAALSASDWGVQNTWSQLLNADGSFNFDAWSSLTTSDRIKFDVQFNTRVGLALDALSFLTSSTQEAIANLQQNAADGQSFTLANDAFGENPLYPADVLSPLSRAGGRVLAAALEDPTLNQADNNLASPIWALGEAVQSLKSSGDAISPSMQSMLDGNIAGLFNKVFEDIAPAQVNTWINTVTNLQQAIVEQRSSGVKVTTTVKAPGALASLWQRFVTWIKAKFGSSSSSGSSSGSITSNSLPDESSRNTASNSNAAEENAGQENGVGQAGGSETTDPVDQNAQNEDPNAGVSETTNDSAGGQEGTETSTVNPVETGGEGEGGEEH
jgi:hypothetical protein